MINARNELGSGQVPSPPCIILNVPYTTIVLQQNAALPNLGHAHTLYLSMVGSRGVMS